MEGRGKGVVAVNGFQNLYGPLALGVVDMGGQEGQQEAPF